MSNKPQGFSYHATRDGLVTIWHQGRPATKLKGTQAAKFLTFCESANEEDQQHRMARLTGNYKRGNES